MSTINSLSAGFYQYFRDRETGAAARQAGDGPHTVEAAATDSGRSAQTPDDARSGTSTALTPAQVRGRLEVLIAGQVATGRLTADEATTLRQSLGPGAAPDAAPAAADRRAAPPGASDDAPSQGAAGTAGKADAYDPAAVLAGFIRDIQRAQPRGASYGSTGASPATTPGSRLLDFNT